MRHVGRIFIIDDEDIPVSAPLEAPYVEQYERRPVLYLADGSALTRRPPGFDTRRSDSGRDQ